MLKKCTAIVGIWLSAAAAGATDWNLGYREGGGGFFLASPDQTFHLTFQGYSQFTTNLYFDEYRASTSRPDSLLGFGVRRARVDLMATIYRSWELLTEIGTPSVRIPGAAVGSDVGIVETRVTTSIYRDFVQLRLGKFVTPFSAENARSSRKLDTVERSTLLNSLIASNLLDVQIGAMLYGRFAEGIFNYYVGIFNGASNPVTVEGDNNGDKEFQVKIVLNPTHGLNLGFAWDTHFDPTTPLSLYDHAFVPYITGVAVGRRHGFEVDLDVTSRIFSFRAEFLGFTYADAASVTNGVRSLWGAYLQAGIFATGGEDGGLELVFRYEFARMNASVTGDLQSGLFGWNWYFNPAMRWQFNYIVEAPSRGTTGVYATAKVKHMILNELQVKF